MDNVAAPHEAYLDNIHQIIAGFLKNPDCKDRVIQWLRACVYLNQDLGKMQ